MAESADLECSGQKGGQDMFLRIRLYKILIANEISEAVDDTVVIRTWHQPKFHQFCPKNWPGNHMGLLRYKAAITGLCSLSDNTFYIIWRVILRKLSECCSIYNKDQSIHFKNKPSCVVEIIGIRNDAIHEPIPGHQLFFCDKMLFHICTYLTINELIFHWAQYLSVSTPATINGESLWDLKLCEMRVLAILLYFTVCDHGDHIQTLQTENRTF